MLSREQSQTHTQSTLTQCSLTGRRADVGERNGSSLCLSACLLQKRKKKNVAVVPRGRGSLPHPLSMGGKDGWSQTRPESAQLTPERAAQRRVETFRTCAACTLRYCPGFKRQYSPVSLSYRECRTPPSSHFQIPISRHTPTQKKTKTGSATVTATSLARPIAP